MLSSAEDAPLTYLPAHHPPALAFSAVAARAPDPTPLVRTAFVFQVITFEYKLLLSRGFDLEMVHPTEHIATLLAVTRAPIEVRVGQRRDVCEP